MSGKIMEPGRIVKISGDYEIVGTRGEHTGKVVTLTLYEIFPETPQTGQGYVLIEKPQHKNN